jgi:FAD/FMN-containing dehydrogenase
MITTDVRVRLSPSAVAALREGFEGELLQPGAPGYDAARTVWNGSIDHRPALIARCASVDDICRALAVGRDAGLPISVRGGGHNVAGSAVADAGLMLDLSLLKAIDVDPAARVARVQPGVLWSELDAATQAHGLAITGGLISSTGVAGFTLGGGIGWLVRQQGLACDQLRAVDLLTADGRLVRASDAQHSELFCGVRGGGGNFGVVTSFEFNLQPVGPMVLGGMLVYPVNEAREVLRHYRDVVASAPDALTSIAAFVTTPDGHAVLAIAGCYAGDPTEGERVVAPLRTLGTLLADHFGPLPYVALQSMLDASAPAGVQNYWKARFLNTLDDDAIDTIVEHALAMASPMSQVHIHHLGGAIARVAPEATAFAHRSAGWALNIVAVWSEPTVAEHERHVAWAREFYEHTAPWNAGAYINFLGDEGQERVRAAYGRNYERLVALKDAWDPDNIFKLNNNIQPSRAASS